MIRIITIHHESDRFLDVQKKYLANYTSASYKVYAGYCGFTPPEIENFVMHNLDGGSIIHCDRLNALVNVAMNESEDGDILIIMDSDTFPVDNNWVNTIQDNLSLNPITAIQRRENSAAGLGCIPELHPHPCFFATTTKFWSEHKLTFGGVPNTGFNIGEWLKDNDLDFTKLLRSNQIDLHPLYFGVYGKILYHHGSGNRLPYDGVDICNRPGLGCGAEMDLKYPKIPIFNQKLSELIYNEINDNDNFIRNFLMGVK